MNTPAPDAPRPVTGNLLSESGVKLFNQVAEALEHDIDAPQPPAPPDTAALVEAALGLLAAIRCRIPEGQWMKLSDEISDIRAALPALPASVAPVTKARRLPTNAEELTQAVVEKNTPDFQQPASVAPFKSPSTLLNPPPHSPFANSESASAPLPLPQAAELRTAIQRAFNGSETSKAGGYTILQTELDAILALVAPIVAERDALKANPDSWWEKRVELLTAQIAALTDLVAKKDEALREIAKGGEGAFSRDQLTHATNVVSRSIEIAVAALALTLADAHGATAVAPQTIACDSTAKTTHSLSDKRREAGT